MTTATRSVAVVATRLPSIDRRALSQAWYSALHLPAPGSPAVAPRTVPPPSAFGRTAAHSLVTGATATRPGSARASISISASKPAPTFPATGERRTAAGELARRIERAVVRAGARPAPVRSAAVTIDGGRIAVLVRTDGATTRIVALCAPHLRERVDRALAQARFTLAASGIRLDLTV